MPQIKPPKISTRDYTNVETRHADMARIIRKTIASFVKFLFVIFSETDIQGLSNVPDEGGCILAMNHLSRLDPPLAYITLKRRDMTALVADKYKTFPGINWLVKLFNGIWVNREDADIKAMKEARDYLRNGGILGIAPEGTRSDTRALIPAKTGVAFLAEKAGVPLVPIAVWGTEKAFSDLLHFHRAQISLRFGESFMLPRLDRRDREASLERNTDEIMCRIAVMLPPEYRGAYADHPRLNELLAVQQETG